MKRKDTPVSQEADKHIQKLFKLTTSDRLSYEVPKAKLFAQCTDEITGSIDKLTGCVDKFTASSSRLSSRIYWLNAILVSATVVMAVAAIVENSGKFTTFFQYFIK